MIRNAKITHTMLGQEDHGILTAYLTLDYGGSGQSFGGWALDTFSGDRVASRRVPSKACGLWIAEVLRVLEVPSWEKLPGTIVRVAMTNERVTAIGHALKEQWFEPAVALREVL